MRKTFILEDLDCANCAAKIETAVAEIEGVLSVSVSFMTQKMILEADEARLDEIVAEIARVIKKVDSDVTFIE